MLYIQIDSITYSGTNSRQSLGSDLEFARELAKDMTRKHSNYEYVTVLIEDRDPQNGNVLSGAIHSFSRKDGWTSEEVHSGNHTCVVTETPDGMGCPTCIYG